MIWIARVSWIALSVLLVALIASPAPSCPVRQIISAPVVVASTPVVVVKEKVVVAEVFTPVFVPTFSVSYSPPPAYPAPQNPNTSSSAQSGPSELAQVLGELRNLGRRIDALERGASPSPKSPPALTPSPKDGAGVTPDGKQTGSKTRLGVLQAQCGQCHTAGKLDSDTTLALLDATGNEIATSAVMEVKLLRLCYAGKMPPPGNSKKVPPLDDEGFAALASGKVGVK